MQVNSFQEGFKLLSNSASLNELSEKFARIIKGTFLITETSIFHKKKSNWLSLYSKNNDSVEYLENINDLEYYSVSEVDDCILIRIPLTDKTTIALIVGPKLDKSKFSELDKLTLQIFIQLFDNAYQSFLSRKKEKELIFSLNHRLVQLNSLIDTGIEIAKLDNNNLLLELALERAVSLTNASKGILRIYKDNKVLGSFRLPNNIDISKVLNSENKIETSVEYKGYTYVVSLVDKESRKGFIDFDDTDEALLAAFARQVSGAVENKQLHKEALENETIKKELSVASSIQKKIIPEKLPEIKGYEMHGTNIPSKEVGGDYYDCIELNDGRFALIIADVAGKGVPASLLVSTLNASLRSYLDMQIPLSEIAIKINKIIYNSSPPDKFITFFISILNPKNGELDIINAGHNPSLIVRNDNTLQKINAGGVAFGMFDMGLPFAGEKLFINPGEKLLLFTDGIPEAMNKDDVEYSDERLESFLLNNNNTSAIDFIENLVADVRLHTENTPQSDDITALFLIRK